MLSDELLAAADEMRDALYQWFEAADKRQAEPTPPFGDIDAVMAITSRHLEAAKNASDRMEKAMTRYAFLRSKVDRSSASEAATAPTPASSAASTPAPDLDDIPLSG